MKKIISYILPFVVLLQLCSCANDSASTPHISETQAPYSIEVSDYKGNSYTLEKAPLGVYVSSPSAADIIVELGCARLVKACSAECKEISGFPSDTRLASGDFITADMLRQQGIDTVILSSHELYDRTDLKNEGFNVFVFADSGTISTAESNIRLAGAIFYKSDRAEEIIDSMRTDIELIRTLAERKGIDRKVYIEIGTPEEYYAVGGNSIVSELVEITGAQNAFKSTVGVLRISANDIRTANPEIIISFVKDEELSLSDVKARDGFDDISACKNGQIYFYSKDFSSIRPSHTIIDALNEIARYVGIN